MIFIFFQLFLTSPSNYVAVILVPPTSIQSGGSLQILALISAECFSQREEPETAALWNPLRTRPVAIQEENTVSWLLLHSEII